jgi:23S rRNA pseudouridine2604 synthase
MSDSGSIRLNKFISESGLCSRREADKYIASGNVFINGKKASIGDQVKVGDRVRVNGNELEPREGEDIIFIALNKPVGIVSTTEKIRDNIVDFVKHSKRIFPIGRLDKDSQGLIFMTNDGDMVNKILRAGNQHEKEYLVTVNKPLTDAVILGMSLGVPMLGIMTKKCKVVMESPTTFRITLIQGLNRQIRRMCEHFGYDVIKLERVRIMNISLKGLPPGDWRDLTEKEMAELHKMVEHSHKESFKKPSEKKPENRKPEYKKTDGSGAKAKGKSSHHGKSDSGKSFKGAQGGKSHSGSSHRKPGGSGKPGGNGKPGGQKKSGGGGGRPKSGGRRGR